MTKPVVHEVKEADHAAWRKKWTDSRKPAAIAGGAQGATEANFTVQHDVKDGDLEKFKKHVDKMELDGKRKEMGAKNKPY